MKASAQLERYITDVAPEHYVHKNAPSTFAGLMERRADFMHGEPLPVSGDGCEHTVYSSPEVNYAFRAWHDGIHIVHGYDFSLAGEQATLAVHHTMMGYRAAEYGLVESDFALMTVEVLGQRMYYERHREYVSNQEAFAAFAMSAGILAAIEGHW